MWVLDGCANFNQDLGDAATSTAQQLHNQRILSSVSVHHAWPSHAMMYSTGHGLWIRNLSTGLRVLWVLF